MCERVFCPKIYTASARSDPDIGVAQFVGCPVENYLAIFEDREGDHCVAQCCFRSASCVWLRDRRGGCSMNPS